MMTNIKIRQKERDTIIQSLRAGVVPRIGLQHIQVGRVLEIESLLMDINRISDGGSSIRFIIGEYGSGKTFFLHLVRSIAIEKNVVTAHADLTPDRRIHATGGQARNLFVELMKNLSTRTKPDGGALPSIVERFICSALTESKEKQQPVESVIYERLSILSEMSGGYDFAHVISSYWKAYDMGNEQLKSDAIRWLRAEYTTKTDAKAALGVRTIIDDANIYDYLKLMAIFIKLAGYSGLLIGLDEMVNLYKLANTQARNANYEQILRILNDCLQGATTNIGFIFCGTPEFLMDTRRGLYSYQALQTRLAENTFAKTAGIIDQSGPVVRLANLTKEDLYILLTKLRHVYAVGDSSKYLVPDEALTAFMSHCSKRIGDAYFRTPRSTTRSFIDLLSVLEKNTFLSWENMLKDIQVEQDVETVQDDVFVDELSLNETSNGVSKISTDNDLTTFKL